MTQSKITITVHTLSLRMCATPPPCALAPVPPRHVSLLHPPTAPYWPHQPGRRCAHWPRRHTLTPPSASHIGPPSPHGELCLISALLLEMCGTASALASCHGGLSSCLSCLCLCRPTPSWNHHLMKVVLMGFHGTSTCCFSLQLYGRTMTGRTTRGERQHNRRHARWWWELSVPRVLSRYAFEPSCNTIFIFSPLSSIFYMSNLHFCLKNVFYYTIRLDNAKCICMSFYIYCWA
jgi:hypothetical protein